MGGRTAPVLEGSTTAVVEGSTTLPLSSHGS
jgi:hypothetical protein